MRHRLVNRKQWLILVLTLLVILVLLESKSLFRHPYQISKSNIRSENSLDETANWQSLSVNNLEFKIPSTWWSYKYEEPGLRNPRYYINPTELKLDNNRLPIGSTFMLFLEPGRTIEERKSNPEKRLYNLKVTNLEESNLILNGFSAYILKGTYEGSGKYQGDLFQYKVAMIPAKEGLYDFSNPTLTPVLEEYFDKILSTFKFSDNSHDAIHPSNEKSYPAEASYCNNDNECVIFTCKCGISLRKDYKGPPPPPGNVCLVVCDAEPKCINNKCTAVKTK